jgi:hypothetical protein
MNTMATLTVAADAFVTNKHSLRSGIVIRRCTVVLLGTSLSGYTILNASQKEADDFDAK